MIRNKRGISLIVLVITIIVMIILSASIILSISNSGIIKKANKATEKSNNASLLEAANIVSAEWNLENKLGSSNNAEEYIKKELKDKGFTDEQIEKLEISSSGIVKLKTYTYYTDSNSKTIPIPLGFVASSATGENTVENGLVIYEGEEAVTNTNKEEAQTTRNQFVWIPVANINEFKIKNILNKYTADSFAFITEPSSYNSSTIGQYSTEVSEYNAMKASVEKYGGFYIGRYEVGTTISRINKTENKTSADILVQKDKYAYTYVGWAPSMTSIYGDIMYSELNQGKGAVELSKEMYKDSSSVVSTLCYGAQWDATMEFMANVDNPKVQGKKYIDDSTGMGWYNDNFDLTNPKPKTGIDIGEDALNKVKNIYDMAGNLAEWTMEAYSTDNRIARGGSCIADGVDSPVSARAMDIPSFAKGGTGFRVALYIK